MDVAIRIYDHLQAACRLLEEADDWSSAAFVSLAMDAVNRRWGVGTDHLAADHPVGSGALPG